MKVFVIGDPHFKTNNAEETNEMSEKILFQIKQTDPDFVVCLGDILDRHETIHVGPLLRSIELFQKIASEYKLFLLIGNHDRPSNQVFLTEEHPFTALKQWKNTWVVDKVIQETITDKNNNPHKFLFVPYVPVGRFKEALQTKITEDQINDFTCIFAHQEFYGAKMGMNISKVGDVWDEENPLVISGHIHDFDILAPNIIYTGTPIQHAFGDREDKGVFLFDFNEKGFTYDKIDLGLPKKKIIKIGFSEVSILKKLDAKSYYKIIISGTPEELKTLKIGSILKDLPRCKVIYKTISSTLDKMNKEIGLENKNFLELLWDEIDETQMEDREDVKEIYQELFGVLETRFVIV
jgi:DNA repair exonuclease SbcCD nuclease subunit